MIPSWRRPGCPRSQDVASLIVLGWPSPAVRPLSLRSGPVEVLLVHLLIGLIVFALVFGLIRLVLPGLGAPDWAITAANLIVAAMFLVWLLYLLMPLLHSAMP